MSSTFELISGVIIKDDIRTVLHGISSFNALNSLKMRIYWDITKMSKNRVFSGLNRVSERLQQAIRSQNVEVIPVAWSVRNTRYLAYPSRKTIRLRSEDIFITPELFSEHERVGVNKWVKTCTGKCVAIFHDAIPLKHPEFTWPKSVARHPFYLKDLAHYDLILANSEYSRNELLDYWKWLELKKTPPVKTIPLGADFAGDARVSNPKTSSDTLHLLMVGILEPRKNHDVVLSAIEILRTQGKAVQLSIVGRVNPHFGQDVQQRIETLIRSGLPIRYHRQVEDDELLELYSRADLSIFPSVVEGNGLPVIESLWRGIPTITSPIPPHLEHARNGEGILVVDPMDATHLASALDALIVSKERLKALQTAALTHKLPTWNDSATTALDSINSLKNSK